MQTETRTRFGVVARMEEHSMVARSRARQAAALQAAEQRAQDAGKSRTKLAAELDFSYDQYARYVNGDTPMRFEQVEQFAGAYDIDELVLGHAILTGDTSAIVSTWDMAAYLRGHVLESDIPGKVAKHKHEPPDVQKAAADSYIRMTRRAQRKATSRRNQSA